MRKRRLLLVAHNYEDNRESFKEVARRVRERAPHISVEVVQDNRYRRRSWRWITRPTLAVSMAPLKNFKLRRGVVATTQRASKSFEMERLESAGVPVPRWQHIQEDQPPDLADYGPYVVVKPNRGSKGAEIKLARKGRVRWKPEDATNGGRLVQEFIYTGEWPISYRVSVLFGRVLYAVRSEANHARVPLRGPDHAPGASIVATAKDATYTLEDSPDVLDLARRAAAAFPDRPIVGVDMIRAHDSGRLYVLEINGGGYTWGFTSQAGRGVQSDHGIDLAGQFDGYAVAAEALIEAVETRAR
ncbi:MAG: ATP-grasp domain-containing protein [Planctomycetota bacterium]|jgi:hypothetical protein